jgi:iron(III) transport system permease protein
MAPTSSSSIPLGVPAVLFGAGFLLTYTEGPFVLYGTGGSSCWSTSR